MKSRPKGAFFPLALVFLLSLNLAKGKVSVDSEILPYNQKDGSWDLVRVDDLKITSLDNLTDGVYLIREARAACSGRGAFDVYSVQYTDVYKCKIMVLHVLQSIWGSTTARARPTFPHVGVLVQ